KFDRNGKNLWTAQIGNSGAVDDPVGTFTSLDISVDDCGSVYLTGIYTLNIVRFGDSFNVIDSQFTINQTNEDLEEGFLVKYTSEGIPVWVVKADTVDTAGLLNLRISNDNCGNVFWVGVDQGLGTRFYDFGQGNGGTENSMMSIFPNSIQMFGFKVSEKGTGLFSWRTGTTGTIRARVPNVAVNNCGDIFVIAHLRNNSPSVSSNFQLFNPGQAGMGGVAFTSFTKTFVGNESSRLFYKLANEVRSANLIGNIQEVLSPTSVRVAFNGGIMVPSALNPNKNYYIDISTNALTTASANNGCDNRKIGMACGTNEIFLIGDQPVCLEPLCINPDFNGGDSRPFRYVAGTFSNGASNDGKVVVRSFVKNSVTVIRSGPSPTGMGGNGYIYTVNIPAGDDIQHISIMDKANSTGNGQLRIIFNWNDTDFVGNTSFPVIPVAPNVTLAAAYGSGTSPQIGDGFGSIRASTTGNEHRINNFGSRSITVSLLTQESLSSWILVNCNF
ncbi:MAG: hypothetical protein WD512_01630, partial [Candidatus Paceibacterota bacterium]